MIMASNLSDCTLTEDAILVSPRQGILQELVETASAVASKQLDGFATRLSEALLRTAQTASDTSQTRLAAQASALLKKNRYPFCFIAGERITAVLQREVHALDDPAIVQTKTGTPQTMQSDVEVDKQLCFLKTGRALEAAHAERLTALSARLAHLLGRSEMTYAENPFRPQVFLAAIHDAWCEFQPDPEAHHLVYPLLQPELCLDIGAILHALNALLIKRAILPNLVVELPPPVETSPVSSDQTDDPLAARLRHLFPTSAETTRGKGVASWEDGLPALFQDELVQATAARNALLAHVALIQRTGAGPLVTGEDGTEGGSLLAHIRTTAPMEARSTENEHTLLLLIRIFDVVFRDSHLAPEMKTLIGSLQVPVLKATLKDKDFFFKHGHPVRRMIELLVRLASGWERRNGLSDPLYQAILRNVKCIQSDQRVAAFADAVADLDAFIARTEGNVEQVLASSIASVVKQEKMQQARKEATHQVALRIGTGEVVAFVETFLEDKWVSVLTLAYAVKDDKPQVLDNAIKTMDDLCWSVKPKITAEERKEFLARLPGIVAMLNKWLDAIKWTAPERASFFEELAKCHASIARAPLEMSPERRLEIALAVAKNAAERRLARQAKQQPEPVPDRFDEQVKNLERGAWLRFTVKPNTTMRARLAWVSPMHSHFIFSTRDKVEALAMSELELAAALREGRAQVLSMPGVVGRALGEALSTNDMEAAA